MSGTSLCLLQRKKARVMCGGREEVLAAEQGQSGREEGPSLLFLGVISAY